jgi:hypothetical protein
MFICYRGIPLALWLHVTHSHIYCIHQRLFSVLSPQRDNYRFLVLWEELGDGVRLDKGEIVCDCELWSASNDAAKAAASAAAEARAVHEAKAAIEAKAASRAQAKADAEAAVEQLQRRFLSAQLGLQKTHNSLQAVRARAIKAVQNMESSGSCTAITNYSDSSTQMAPTLSPARTAFAVAATTDLAAPRPASDGAKQRGGTMTSAIAADAHAVAVACNARRQRNNLLPELCQNGVASQHLQQ